MANGKIAGKLYKQTSGDLVSAWGEGYFLALKFVSSDWDKFSSVKVGLDPSESSGLVEVLNDPDKNGAFKITNPTDQKFKVEATTKTGDTLTATYDLDGLTGWVYDEEEHDYVVDPLF